METELYKRRSVSSCIKAAFDLFSTNAWSILRKTWKPALVLSLLLSLTTVLASPQALLATGLHMAEHPTLLYAAMLGSVLLVLVAYIWFLAAVMGLLNGQSMDTNLPRMARLVLTMTGLGIALTLATLGISFGIGFSTGGHDQLGKLALGGVIAYGLMFVELLVLLPLAYSSMKYCMEPQQRVGTVFGRPLLTGFHHWGYLFLTALLVAIITLILSCIFMLPLAILYLAGMVNTSGMLLGDPSLLPAWFGPLNFVVGAMCQFADCYVMVWVLMVFHYAYGHIETLHCPAPAL